MRFSSYVAAVTALATAAQALPSSSSGATKVVHARDETTDAETVTTDIAEAQTEFSDLVTQITTDLVEDLSNTTTTSKRSSTKCTSKNIVYRKEYGSLTKAERLDYVRAVKCLMSLPPKTPASVAPGAKSRYDDFNVVHIQMTLGVHYTGNFQAWHRWFVYTYEQALRNECGYKGYQPYWDWPKYANAPQNSPIFDGSPYSLGGNGEYVPHDGPIVAPPPGSNAEPIQLAAGVGGGPVRTGPFANWTVTLGPVLSNPGPMGGLGDNPRLLKRDVGPALNIRYGNYSTVLALLKKPDIDSYRFLSEGVAFTAEIGPHGGMHYVIGGDPGGDFFTSPGDPAFWVHHAQMDRMWTLWQTLDPKTRYTDLGSDFYAHQTWWNSPESPLTSLDDVLALGYAGGNITIREVMDTTKGPFCYFYA